MQDKTPPLFLQHSSMTPHTRKTVLITGCSAGGIGSALVEAFHEQDLHVFATARTLSKMAHLQNKPNVTLLTLDVTCSDSISSVVEAVKCETGGTLDYLINNSGVGHAMPILDVNIDEARKVFDVNIWGVLAVTQAFTPLLIVAEGTIANIGSVVGHLASPWIGIYGASKTALEMVTETLRLEMAPFNVKVMTVVTGRVTSNFTTNNILHYLPPSSRYLTIKDYIAARAIGEKTPHGMTAEKYARKVVSDVLGGKNGIVWRGGFASVARVVLLLIPVFILDAVVVWNSGLNILRRKRVD